MIVSDIIALSLFLIMWLTSQLFIKKNFLIFKSLIFYLVSMSAILYIASINYLPIYIFIMAFTILTFNVTKNSKNNLLIFFLLIYPVVKLFSLKKGYFPEALFAFFISGYQFSSKNDLNFYLKTALNKLFIFTLVPLKKIKKYKLEYIYKAYVLFCFGITLKYLVAQNFDDYTNWFWLSYFNLNYFNLAIGVILVVLSFIANVSAYSYLLAAVLLLFNYYPIRFSKLNIFDMNPLNFFIDLYYPFRLIFFKINKKLNIFFICILFTLICDFSVKGLVAALWIYIIIKINYKINSKKNFIIKMFNTVALCCYIFLIRSASIDELLRIVMVSEHLEYKFSYPRDYLVLCLALTAFFLIQLIQKFSVYRINKDLSFKIAILIFCTILAFITISQSNGGHLKTFFIPF